jgi:hypothetical protein
MGLRESINRHQGIVATTAGLGIVIAIALVLSNGAKSRGARSNTAFYSDDDGQTYFRDDIDKLYPFDHNGKQAYRADVFKCSDGTVFVGVLSRLTDRAKSRLQELRSQQNPDVQAISDTIAAGTEIKKPGDSKWYSASSSEAGNILLPKCPNGGAVVGVAP